MSDDGLSAANEGAPSMNVLHVISDQHLATCTGIEGHPHAITPNMDRLASEGVYFSRAYTQNPICTPSRVSVFSGQYCHNHGYYGLSGPTPPNLPGFLGHFQEQGYRTGGIGKLHMPDDPVSWLDEQCDLVADCYMPHRKTDESTPYYDYLEDLGLRDKEDSVALREFKGNQHLDGRPSQLPYEHSVEGWCVAEAIKFIDGCQGDPFCMQVSLPRPHQCYTPDRRFWDMYPDDLPPPETIDQDTSGRPPHFRVTAEAYRSREWLIEPRTFEAGSRRSWRAYLACITQVDHSLGLLMDHLEKAGLAENTIVIYSADHGAYTGTFGIPEKAPGICSEAVCRVPMIWCVPRMTESHRRCSEFVENVDIAPTLAALCGLPAMETADGVDITPLLKGDDTPLREVAVTENPWSKALRWRNWRFVHYQPTTFDGMVGIADEDKEDVGELYDLESDPLETRNLYRDPAHRDVVNDCRKLLLEWLIRTTRITTIWPPPGYPPIRYATAADGKESNMAGAEVRRDQGEIWYL